MSANAGNFPISFYTDNVFSYAVCDEVGNGLAVNSENKQINTSPETCTLGTADPVISS